MSGAKFFVFAGRWREVDAEQGSVAGWQHGSRFVYVRGGKLELADTAPVLEALRALAAGKPSAAADGPRLPLRKVFKHKTARRKDTSTQLTLTQFASAVNVGIQTDTPVDTEFTLDIRQAGTGSKIRKGKVTDRPKIGPASKTNRPKQSPRITTRVLSVSDLSPSDVLVEKKQDKRRSPARGKPKGGSFVSGRNRRRSSSLSYESGINRGQRRNSVESDVKELVVSESDVAALRGFVASRRGAALERYDADESYRRALFYAINPLVHLERSANVTAALRARDQRLTAHFAARLGLARTSDATPSPVGSTKRRTRNATHYKEADTSSDSDSDSSNDQPLRIQRRISRDTSSDTDKENFQTGRVSRNNSKSRKGTKDTRLFSSRHNVRSVLRGDNNKTRQSLQNTAQSPSSNKQQSSAHVSPQIQKTQVDIKQKADKDQSDTIDNVKVLVKRKGDQKESNTEDSDDNQSVRELQNRKSEQKDRDTEYSDSDESDSNKSIRLSTNKKSNQENNSSKKRVKVLHKQNDPQNNSDPEEIDNSKSVRGLRNRKSDQNDNLKSDNDSNKLVKMLRTKRPNVKDSYIETSDSGESDSNESLREMKNKKNNREDNSKKSNKVLQKQKMPQNNSDSEESDSNRSLKASKQQKNNKKDNEKENRVLRNRKSDQNDNDSNKQVKMLRTKRPNLKDSYIENSDSEESDNNNSLNSQEDNSKKSNNMLQKQKMPHNNSDSEKSDSNRSLQVSKKQKDNQRDNEKETNRLLRNRKSDHKDSDTEESDDNAIKVSKKQRDNQKDNDKENSKNNHVKVLRNRMGPHKNTDAEESDGNKSVRALRNRKSNQKNSDAEKSDSNLRVKVLKKRKSDRINRDKDEEDGNIGVKVLRKRNRDEKNSDSEDNSSNKTVKVLQKKKSPEEVSKTPKGHIISNRACASTLREYSNLEDHAIVAWVSTGARATRVKGNALWRDLQEQYQRLTGQSRSWHSLRNRYLRYILPSLRALHLPPSTEARLRAAAATGILNSGDKRNNSIFHESRVISASARYRNVESPRKNKDTAKLKFTEVPSGKTKTDTKNTSDSPKKADSHKNTVSDKSVRKSPRYSDITRRYTTPPSSEHSAASNPHPPQPRSRRLFNPNKID